MTTLNVKPILVWAIYICTCCHMELLCWASSMMNTVCVSQSASVSVFCGRLVFSEGHANGGVVVKERVLQKVIVPTNYSISSGQLQGKQLKYSFHIKKNLFHWPTQHLSTCWARFNKTVRQKSWGVKDHDTLLENSRLFTTDPGLTGGSVPCYMHRVGLSR